MDNTKGKTRRSVLKMLAASGAAAAVSSGSFAAEKKRPGETRVLFLIGDYWHNAVTQEKNWQYVLDKAGWRLMFAQGARFVTPEVLAETDLFVVSRYFKANSLGFSPDEIVERRLDEIPFLTEECEETIIGNVKRGMGLLAMHCSIWHPEKEKFLELLGVKEPKMHTKVQPAFMHKLNANHPITAGVEPRNLGEDEIFYADLIPGMSQPLFNLKGEEQPIDREGGWCHDYGKGRIVVLLPGHTPHPFHRKDFKEVMWRSAHWAMKKDIPATDFKDGRPPERTVYR